MTPSPRVTDHQTNRGTSLGIWTTGSVRVVKVHGQKDGNRPSLWQCDLHSGSMASGSTAASLTEFDRERALSMRGFTFEEYPGSPTPFSSISLARTNKYMVDPTDLIDEHVGYYLNNNPEVYERHKIARKSPGSYEFDGREVEIVWEYPAETGGKGYLVVVDGPLRQPFSDYMENTDKNAVYQDQDLSKPCVHQIPRERRLSFDDDGDEKAYSRLESMKVAKEQALVREKAAGFVKDGKGVPEDIMMKYKKSLQIKLGLARKQPALKLERSVGVPRATSAVYQHGDSCRDRCPKDGVSPTVVCASSSVLSPLGTPCPGASTSAPLPQMSVHANQPQQVVPPHSIQMPHVVRQLPELHGVRPRVAYTVVRKVPP